jgi:uncharacterized HAD superfamily protein
MQVILVIDGTLCFSNTAFFFQLCNTTFALGIAEERFVSHLKLCILFNSCTRVLYRAMNT